ncbi:alpha-amylase family glycosyl hydrolase [Carboxylicivirga sp. M1479]|uniref:alpha-amylase family glycosyl hydrolase n=1 Tax=Carboxylicivirga sp. M1479 TaxID=2594476 RepID=UPI001177ECB6|nr:alpha-amylase family glycosyl hydrolase [Carboxylicivirga sp. M1479]TRX66037.1 alpha-amlyase [Carboxylicivirga sp. M1479]
MKNSFPLLIFMVLLLSACAVKQSEKVDTKPDVPFIWENANVYFLLTDRFNNGNANNDVNFNRTKKSGKLRGFMGGDIKGITEKIKEGYFTDLGINAIWFSPVVEQIHGSVDEGTGSTYGFHGYWTRDWTALEPNFGSEEELSELVQTAHKHGIRIVMDVVINHTGPVTDMDPFWGDEWARTEPQCTYEGYESTVTCTLVKNLPDILTEKTEEVELPKALLEKWADEGRLEKEMDELDAFFIATGYPRTPRYYIIKWLTDYIRKYGVDAFRLDTVKHTEASVWADLWKEASKAFEEWKAVNPDLVVDDNPFFMVGEVYNYGVSGGRWFDFGDKKVDYFANGMQSLINFEFKYDATKSYEEIFSKYSDALNGPLKGYSVINYASSHDDGGPFDKQRTKTIEAGTKLLLCPGSSQVYYGDETGRSLDIEGTVGDATLRSFMNWDELEANSDINGVAVQGILSHWQKLGQFRAAHPAVGAGVHLQLSAEPYYFKRTYKSSDYNDQVIVGLDLDNGVKTVDVKGVFKGGEVLKDYYSGTKVEVKNGKVELDTDFEIVLLGS